MKASQDPANGDLGVTVMSWPIGICLALGIVWGLLDGAFVYWSSVGLAAGVFVSLVASIVLGLRMPPRSKGECLQCGYPCDDLESGPCPECGCTGRAVDLEDRA